jgi:hypothetical protein
MMGVIQLRESVDAACALFFPGGGSAKAGGSANALFGTIFENRQLLFLGKTGTHALT